MPATLLQFADENVGFISVDFSAQNQVSVQIPLTRNRSDVPPQCWLTGGAGAAAKRWAAPFITGVSTNSGFTVVVSLANAADVFTGTVILGIKWY